MEDLPTEMLVRIWEWTEKGTRRVLGCVSPRWIDISKVEQARSSQGLWRRCSDGTRCRLKQRCAAQYASRMAKQRLWNVFEWMVDLAGPFGDRNTADKAMTEAAAEDADTKRLEWLAEQKGYRWDVDKIAEKGARYGHKVVVEWARDRGGPQGRACEAAIKGGRLEMLRWLFIETDYKIDGGVSMMAASRGDNAALDLLEESHFIRIAMCFRGAAAAGRTDIIDRFLAGGRPCGHGGTLDDCRSECMLLAAKGGHTKTVEQLCQYGRPCGGMIREAARGGHQGLIEWLQRRGRVPTADATAAAAEGGHLDLLVWMAQRGYPLDEEVFVKAGTGGHVAIMEWAWNHGLGWWRTTARDHTGHDAFKETDDRMLMTAVAEAGQLGALKWLREHGCAWGPSMCEKAIAKGHLHVAAWAHREGCPWNLYQCVREARDTDILEWLMEESDKREWNDTVGQACVEAIVRHRFETAEWLLTPGGAKDQQRRVMAMLAGLANMDEIKWAFERGCEWDSGETYASLVCRDCPRDLLWVRERGCPWDARACEQVARYGQPSMLRWLREQGCPWDERTCAGLASRGDLATLRWARSEGCPWDEETCQEAARRMHFHVLKWAIENGCPYD